MASADYMRVQFTGDPSHDGDTDSIPLQLGRYRVLGRIGRGGMGEVFRAYDPELGRTVAIKTLRGLGHDDDAKARILREAQAIARLDHPHVVQIFDVGHDQVSGDVFIAMEYVEGSTLRALLERGPLPWSLLSSIFQQTGEALLAAHEAGLVHRDFKPENVLVTAGGRAKVVDFGLAKPVNSPSANERTSTDYSIKHIGATGMFGGASSDIDKNCDAADSRSTSAQQVPSPNLGPEAGAHLTPAGTRLGTPAYMPPEQTAEIAVSPTADQFAFAVSLYESICGYLPFSGDTPTGYSLNILDGKIRPFVRDGHASRRLRRAIVRALHPDPSQRHPSLAALLAELRRPAFALSRRSLATAGTAAVVGCLVLLSARMLVDRRDATSRACSADIEQLSQWWNSDTRSRLAQALTSAPGRYGGETAEATIGRIDNALGEWQRRRMAWCAASPPGDRPEHHQATGTCLDGIVLQGQQLVTAVTAADTQAVVRAGLAGQQLTRDLSHCDDPLWLAQLESETAGEDKTILARLVNLLVEARLHLELYRFDVSRLSLRRFDDSAAALATIPPSLSLERDVLSARLQRRSGDLEGARMTLEGAAHTSLGVHAPLLVAEWNSEYADVLYALGAFDLMGPAYERPWQLRRLHLGEDNIDTIVAQACRGHVPYAKGDYAAALSLYGAAANRAQELMEEDAPSRVLIEQWVAQSFGHLGDLDQAIRITEDLTRRLQASAGSDHPDTLDMHHTLATLYLRAGSYGPALAQLESLLEVIDEHPELMDALGRVAVLANLGGALTGLERIDAAEVALRRALTEHQQLSGSGFVSTTSAIEANLAGILIQQGRGREALTIYDRLLATADSRIDKAASDVVAIRMGRADALEAVGRQREAVAMLMDVIASARQAGDDTLRGRAHTKLAKLLDALGETEQADSQLQAARAALGKSPESSRWREDVTIYERTRVRTQDSARRRGVSRVPGP